MNRKGGCGAGKQRGAVLIIALIVLVVMNLFVISMLRTTVIELKIGGASQVATTNFANAQLAIDNFYRDNQGRFAPGFLTLPVGAGGAIQTPPSVHGGSVAVTVTQVTCGPPSAFGTDPSIGMRGVTFDTRAVATGTLGGTTVMHEGVQALAPPGAC